LQLKEEGPLEHQQEKKKDRQLKGEELCLSTHKKKIVKQLRGKWSLFMKMGKRWRVER
jgi:hypothetical protein